MSIIGIERQLTVRGQHPGEGQTIMCGILAYAGTELSGEALSVEFAKVQGRGPDYSVIAQVASGSWLGFHRLAIMDPTPAGNQPFYHEGASLVCNGEIYNHEILAKRYGFTLNSGSDCEVILHMFRRFGIERTCRELDGVFSFAIFDGETMYVARDPIGIRPLFIGERHTKDGLTERLVCSELRGIHAHCDSLEPFKPAHFARISLARWPLDLAYYSYEYPEMNETGEAEIMAMPREKLIAAVDKRNDVRPPDRVPPIWRRDSSSRCTRRHYPRGTMHTFNVGLDTGASDRAYARMVADHIGSIHHEVTITRDEGYYSKKPSESAKVSIRPPSAHRPCNWPRTLHPA